MARGHPGVELGFAGHARFRRDRVVRQQRHQRVEQVALAQRLRQIGGEQRPRVAGFPPPEAAEQHQRQLALGLADAPGQIDAVHLGHVHVDDRDVEALARPRASAALRQVTPCPCGAMPHLAVCSASTRRLVALSSTTSTRAPESAACGPTKVRRPVAGRSASGTRMVKRNVDPWPGPGLCADIDPDISSASRLLMARPRPVPPYLRVVDASAWLKLWNSLPIPSGVSPIPVSRTENSSSTGAGPPVPWRWLRACRVHADVQHDFSGFGELDRVREQVQQDLPQPRHVALDPCGTSPSNT